MWDIKTLVKDYFKTKTLQEFINNRFWDTNRLIIPHIKDKDGKYDYSTWMKIVSHDGITFFYWDELVTTIDSVKHEYSYDDIRPTDIVLDIGGCIGAYSMFICNKVKHVYTLEPILHERIKKNIELTNKLMGGTIKNIDVIIGALGNDGVNSEISFQNNKATVPCYSLSTLKQLCGGHIDVLKIDCEGGEWCITPSELSGIRRIEAEIHTGESMEYHGGESKNINAKKLHFADENNHLQDYLNMLTDAGFEHTHTILDEHTALVHGVRI